MAITQGFKRMLLDSERITMMHKRKLQLALIIALLIQTIAQANPILLTIRLEGYQPLEHNNFAYIILPDVNQPYKEQYKISDEGSIQVSLLIDNTRELIFSYNDREIGIIVCPDELAELHFSIETFQSMDGPVKGKFRGVHQQAVTLMMDYLPTLQHWINSSSSAFSADKSIKISDYKTIRLNELSLQIQALERLILIHKIDNEWFIQWAKSKLRYAAANDLCLFPMMGRVNTDIHEADPYFDFISRFTPEHDFVFTLQSYTDYIKLLISDLNIIGNIADKHRARRDSLKLMGSIFPLKFDIVRSVLKGKDLTLALANLYLNTKVLPPGYLDSLNQYMPELEMQKLEKVEMFIKTPVMALLNNFPLRDEEKKPLLDLYEGMEGKIIYHDFWFTQCEPCMRELPHYNQLISRAGSDVEFIFFGVYMQEKEWKEAIAKYGLIGKHYLLSKNQVAFFERYFKLNGYPHHQLVNSNGIAVKSHLPTVIPENYETILKSLDNLRH